MKIKQLLSKTLLVAAGLCLGANSAWADATSLYERGTTNAWTDDDLTDWTQSYCTATINNGLSVSTTNAGWTCTKSISVTENAIVTLDATLKTGTAPGRSGSYDYIKIGGVTVGFNEQDKVAFVDIDNSTTNLFEKEAYSRSTAYDIQIVINQATGDVDYTVGSASGTGSSTTAITNVVFGHSKAGRENYTINPVLQKIEVQEEKQAVTNVGYTINYQLSGTTVKTVAGTSVVGAEITASTAIDGTEEGYEGNHYLITAAEAPSMTLVAEAASNVLNVPVRAPYTATLTVTKTIAGEAQTPVVTNLIETDAKVCSWTYTYPMYVQQDGVYYVADETTTFGESGTFENGDAITKTVAYTNPDYSVVYFGEPNESAGTNTAYSNGSTGYITGGVGYSSNAVIRLGKLQAGTYHLITNITGDANRNLVVGDYSSGTESFPTALVTITTTGEKDETFTVDGTQLICISGKDQGTNKFNQSATLDYVLVKASTASATIKTTGTTFASAYAIDCDNLPAGVTAYKIEGVSEKKAQAVKVTGTVKAGTGLILMATTEKSYDIPVAASGSEVTSNKLVGVTTNTEIADDAAYGLSDGKFVKLAAGTIKAGKAYLPASAVSAPELTIDFGGVTGIDAALVKSEKRIENSVYDLQGRKVAQPTKGLYIMDGRKVVVK